MAKRVNKRVLIILTVGVIVLGVLGMGASIVGPKLFRKSAQALITEADRKEKAGDLDEAFNLYGQACSTSPRDPSLRVAMGDLYARHADGDRLAIGKAVQKWEEALGIDPAYKPALERMLDLHWTSLELNTNADTVGDIRKTAQKILTAFPDDQSARLRMHVATIRGAQAGIPINSSEIEASIKALRELAKTSPADANLPYWAAQGELFLISESLRRSSDQDEAREMLAKLEPQVDEMLKGQDNNALMQFRGAQLYYAIAQVDAQISRNLITPQTRPATRPSSQPVMHPAVAKRAAQIGNALAAARQYSKPTDDEFVNIQLLSSDWLRAEGKVDEANKIIDYVIEKSGNDPEVRLILTRAFRQDPKRRQQLLELLARPIATDKAVGVQSVVIKQRADAVRYELASLKLTNLDDERDPAKRKKTIEDVQADLKYFEAAAGSTSPAVLDLRGRLLLAQGRTPEGISALQQYVDHTEIGLASFEAIARLANAYVVTGQTGQADKLLQELISRYPDNSSLQAQRIAVLVSDGNLQEARRQLDSFRKRWPDARELAALEAEVVGGKKRDEFVGQMPENTAAERVRKAAMLRSDGKTDHALQLAQAAFKQDPKYLPAVNLLLEMHMAAGQREEAMAVAQAAIKANPDNAQLKLIPDRLSQRTPEEFEKWVLDQINQETDSFSREMKLFEFYLQKSMAAAQARKPEEQKKFADQSEKHLITAEKIKPDDKAIGPKRFEFLVKQRRFDEAGVLLQRLSAANVDGVNGQLLRYQLSLAKNDLAGAEAAARDMTRQHGEFAAGWQYLGLTMQAQGRFREAIDAYTNAIDRQGRNYEALKGLIQTYYALNNVADAKSMLDRARQIYPEDVTLREMSLEHEMEYGDPMKVIATREQLFKDNPESPGNAMALANAYLRTEASLPAAQSKDLIAKARKVLDDGMKKWPSDSRFQAPLAQVMLAQGDFIGGEALLKQRTESPEIKNNPGAAEMMLGEFYVRANKPALAEESLREAAKKSGDAPAAKMQLAALYAGTSRIDEAVKELQGVPGSAAARQRIGYLMNANRTADVDQALREAVAANPASNDLSNMQLEFFVKEKRFDDAQSVVQQRLAKNNADDDARYFSAMIKLRRQPPAAADAAKELVEISGRNPRSVPILNLLADAHIASGDIEAGIDDLGRALRQSPNDEALRVKLIGVLGGQRRWDAIITLASDAMRMPRIAQNAYWPRSLAKAQSATGKAADAEKSMLQAIALTPADSASELQKEYLTVLLQGRNPAKVLQITDDWIAKGRKDWWIYQQRGLARTAMNDKTAAREFEAALSGLDPVKQFTEADAVVRTIAASDSVESALKRIAAWETTEPRWRIVAAELLAAKGDFAGGIPHLLPLEAGAEKLPEDVRSKFYVNLAQCYHQAQPKPDLEKAATYYQKYLQITPDDIFAMNNVAYLLSEQIQPPRMNDAKVYSKMAYDIARDWRPGEAKSRILDTYGWILVLNGGADLDQGIRILEESVDEAAILEARYHLGEAQLQKKRSEEATEQLTAALGMIEKAKKDNTPYDESLEPRIQRALERAKSSGSAAQAR